MVKTELVYEAIMTKMGRVGTNLLFLHFCQDLSISLFSISPYRKESKKKVLKEHCVQWMMKTAIELLTGLTGLVLAGNYGTVAQELWLRYA